MPNLVNVVIPPLAQPYTYQVPSSLSSIIEIGSPVRVPLGKRYAQGYVVERISSLTQSDRDFALKDVSSALTHYPFFDEVLLNFFNWIANYYQVSLSQVLDVALPSYSSRPSKTKVSLIDKGLPRGALQQKIVVELQNSGGSALLSTLLKTASGARGAVARLEQRGVVALDTTEQDAAPLLSGSAPDWAKSSVALGVEQSQITEKIVADSLASRYQPYLLHGVTGSGKTEVYIEAIRQIRAADGGALILVPEIALTPQLVDRFRARLGNNLAILHSGLNKRSRWESWRALLEGRTKIALGARSAIFAPVKDLRLIVVDEEHDGSYKQNDSMRYNARDLALVRGKLSSCPVVLGSATPSLESYYHARRGKYALASLPAPHSASPLAKIELVDLHLYKAREMPSKNIAPELHLAIGETLTRGEQAFILFNRRGFASYLQCEKCEETIHCPHCSVTLTYYQRRHILLCHHCGYALVPYERCTKCGQQKPATAETHQQSNRSEFAVPGKLIHRGAGTERVVDEIRALFPEARVDRLDRDVVTKAAHYREILDRVRSGETQILVGTQMIAKGHDLPGVTLVGVVDCDVGLHLPDFRASERVFQLLTQAAGRAGRADKPGRVLLQTRVPTHRVLQMTERRDFTTFAALELTARKETYYPPYSRVLRIVASSIDKELSLTALKRCRQEFELAKSNGALEVHVLGPIECPLERLQDRFRSHLILKAGSPKPLQRAIAIAQATLKKSTKVRVIYDLDPQEML